MKILRFNIFLVLVIQLIIWSVQPAFAQDDQLFTPSGIAISELENEIDMFMKERIGSSAPGAAVAIIKNGEIVLSKGYGYADIENKKPVTPDTVFEYGSISKLFIWTSIMQLAEQGKLDLDKDIKEYLPEEFYEKLNLKYTISLREIMNHSSGFGEYPYDLIKITEPTDLSLADVILMNHPKQYFKPGTSSVYSNYATALAAFVVENISGEEFYKYQKEHIFEPLNMNTVAGHRKWEDNPDILAKKAMGYTKKSETEFRDSGWSYVSLYPAGSVSGTVKDLALFAIELMPANENKTLLFTEKETLLKVLSPSYKADASGTAHGFFEYDFPEKQTYGHGGNTASFSSQFAFVPDESFGFVVLTNVSSEMDITMGLQDMLLGSREVKVSKNKDHNLIDAHKLEGTYVNMRRPEGTPSEFISYLSLVNIKAIDENKISIKMMGLSASYYQTASHKFSLSETSHPLFKVYMPNLTFQLDDKDNPETILVGNGFDFSALPASRTMPKLIANLSTLIISFIFLIVNVIAIIVYLLKRRNNPDSIIKSIYTPRVLLTFTGIILIANNIVVIITLIFNPFIQYESLKPMLILNYIITIFASIFIILGFVKWKKELNKYEKTGFILTTIIVVSLISLFINWNLYTIF